VINQASLIFNDVLPKTHFPFQISADNIEDIDTRKADIESAINVVDAQFYYTNPLVFAFAKDSPDINLQDWGHLWGNYYLVNIMDLAEFVPTEAILAVNHRFLEQIGQMNLVMENDMIDFQALHEEHGLYVVAIVEGEKIDEKTQAEAV